MYIHDIYIYVYIYVYMVFTTEGFLEVAIEFVGFEPVTTEFRSEALTN